MGGLSRKALARKSQGYIELASKVARRRKRIDSLRSAIVLPFAFLFGIFAFPHALQILLSLLTSPEIPDTQSIVNSYVYDEGYAAYTEQKADFERKVSYLIGQINTVFSNSPGFYQSENLQDVLSYCYEVGVAIEKQRSEWTQQGVAHLYQEDMAAYSSAMSWMDKMVYLLCKDLLNYMTRVQNIYIRLLRKSGDSAASEMLKSFNKMNVDLLPGIVINIEQGVWSSKDDATQVATLHAIRVVATMAKSVGLVEESIDEGFDKARQIDKADLDEFWLAHASSELSARNLLIGLVLSVILYRVLLVPLLKNVWVYLEPNSAHDKKENEFPDYSVRELRKDSVSLHEYEESLKEKAASACKINYAIYAFLSLAAVVDFTRNTLTVSKFVVLPFISAMALDLAHKHCRHAYNERLFIQKTKAREGEIKSAFPKELSLDFLSRPGPDINSSFVLIQAPEHAQGVGKSKLIEFLMNVMAENAITLSHADIESGMLLVAMNQTFDSDRISHRVSERFNHFIGLNRVLNSLEQQRLPSGCFYQLRFDDSYQPSVQFVISKSKFSNLSRLNLAPFDEVSQTEGRIVLELTQAESVESIIAFCQRLAQFSLPNLRRTMQGSADESSRVRAPVSRRQKQKLHRRSRVETSAKKPQSHIENEPLTLHLRRSNRRVPLRFNLRLEGCDGDERLFGQLRDHAQVTARSLHSAQGVIFPKEFGGEYGYVKLLGEFGDIRLGLRRCREGDETWYETRREVTYNTHQRERNWRAIFSF